MANKLAVYNNPYILAVVSRWFEETYGKVAALDNGFLTVRDLYQSYSEYTVSPEFIHERLNLSEFAKCIVACRILDIGGRFVYRPEYKPAISAITRATA